MAKHKSKKQSKAKAVDFNDGLQRKILKAPITHASASYLSSYAEVQANGIERILAESQRDLVRLKAKALKLAQQHAGQPAATAAETEGVK
jgi:hypothetical protein